jgi:hypothetical protein
MAMASSNKFSRIFIRKVLGKEYITKLNSGVWKKELCTYIWSSRSGCEC